ncbi:tyrosyl-tRNA synthetase [Chitinophaga costaii]|uniref:Tyrosine--tRNA ligase n=1 Tax=Chitinophaga costaii TaxID=1335309 RepID=A0A1C4G248_9BACT|nr:tyrosine--tRNA ligase [Chitinophaga costaii]PUZ19929.1 tyrosine--tRNA ligase [Chitinophaga costaii]SCC62033.1 tyrosyl-tRNA synthetase [Chitinophaga costaii]
MNLIEELRWRGMLQDIMPGTEEQLQQEMTIGYIGFDPTADSLHIGSLVPIILLVHLQKAGHKPIALVGGATGMVGDPSFKAEERKMLDEITLQHNQAGIRAQLERFLDFNPSLPNAAEIVNNFDWFKSFTFLDFIREVGKHITVNYMMSKDSVRKRLEGDNGMSFTEFTYQLIQGYDFFHLFTDKKVKLQMGGSDQWGNIVTGTELIRRKAGGEAFAFTCKLLTKSDGSKFGKSEGGNVWLDRNKTSPYKFYQYWLNCADEDAARFIKIFTFLDQPTINALIDKHAGEPHLRLLQKELARLLTIFVHSESDYEFAVKASEMLFGNNTADMLRSLDERQLLEVLDGVDQVKITRAALAEAKDIVSFTADNGIFPSKSEARKMVQNGGVSINKQKVEGIDATVNEQHLLNEKYILVQKGKRNYYLVVVQ